MMTTTPVMPHTALSSRRESEYSNEFVKAGVTDRFLFRSRHEATKIREASSSSLVEMTFVSFALFVLLSLSLSLSLFLSLSHSVSSLSVMSIASCAQ